MSDLWTTPGLWITRRRGLCSAARSDSFRSGRRGGGGGAGAGRRSGRAGARLRLGGTRVRLGFTGRAVAGTVGRRLRRRGTRPRVRPGIGAVETTALENHADRAIELTQWPLALGAVGQTRVGERLDHLTNFFPDRKKVWFSDIFNCRTMVNP